MDVAEFQVSLADILEPEKRSAGLSGASSELAIQNVFWDSAILHAYDVTEPA